jgi:hypothetical protein
LATTIRAYGAGDDAAQVGIYNEAAGGLPGFKPATLDEVRRRGRDPVYDPSARFMALADGRPVGYVTFQTNGRVSHPWCRAGYEAVADALLSHVLEEMKRRGMDRAWAAYRADWKAPLAYLAQHGFVPRREMVNFVLDLVEMPTPTSRPNSAVSPLRPEDVPAVFALGAGVLRARTAEDLARHLLHNPYFPARSVFVLRRGAGTPPVAAGVLVTEPSYADPHAIDPAMPCFRLGAFGTEGLTAKRVRALFSFLAGNTPDANVHGLDLMSHAAMRLQDTDLETLAAQVPSDAPHLLRFYNQYCRRQGSFPVLERAL